MPATLLSANPVLSDHPKPIPYQNLEQSSGCAANYLVICTSGKKDGRLILSARLEDGENGQGFAEGLPQDTPGVSLSRLRNESRLRARSGLFFARWANG